MGRTCPFCPTPLTLFHRIGNFYSYLENVSTLDVREKEGPLGYAQSA